MNTSLNDLVNAGIGATDQAREVLARQWERLQSTGRQLRDQGAANHSPAAERARDIAESFGRGLALLLKEGEGLVKEYPQSLERVIDRVEKNFPHLDWSGLRARIRALAPPRSH